MDGIRPLAPDDYSHAARIFFCAVHEGTRDVYSLRQRLAWAGETVDLERWRARVAAMQGFVAEADGEPVGFMTIDAEGHVDLAFVLPSQARRGVGARLLGAVEDWARARGVARLTAHASLAATPFFARHGWAVVAREQVRRSGVALARNRMERPL